MSPRIPILIVSMLPLCASAQQAGVPTEWDVQKLVEAISTQSGRLQQIVDQIHPKEWVAKGAPDAYLQQWDSAHAQAATVKQSSDNLVRDPARLSSALDTYFRLQNLEVVLTSLIEGVRKYQNPALADLLRGVMSENNVSRQQLRQYLADLATIKEEEFKVMDREAQRCREAISGPAATSVQKKTGK